MFRFQDEQYLFNIKICHPGAWLIRNAFLPNYNSRNIFCFYISQRGTRHSLYNDRTSDKISKPILEQDANSIYVVAVNTVDCLNSYIS